MDIENLTPGDIKKLQNLFNNNSPTLIQQQKENNMDIENLTLGDIKKLQNLFNNNSPTLKQHPMLGRRCLIRTYSAGVHIGDVTWINPESSMECKLENALRLWRWEGGLSLSAVASNGIKGGRLNKTSEIMLTNAIEYIPTTEEAEETYGKFTEDKK